MKNINFKGTKLFPPLKNKNKQKKYYYTCIFPDKIFCTHSETKLHDGQNGKSEILQRDKRAILSNIRGIILMF